MRYDRDGFPVPPGFEPTPPTPETCLAVTVEMQSQAIKFAATAVAPGGPFVYLTNPTVLDLN
jgi:hypothetical protein